MLQSKVVKTCAKKSVRSKTRALKKACAHKSVRSKKRVLTKACDHKSVRSQKHAFTKACDHKIVHLQNYTLKSKTINSQNRALKKVFCELTEEICSTLLSSTFCIFSGDSSVGF